VVARLSDGMPMWDQWSEETLVGAAMQADYLDVLVASLAAPPEDFRDRSLGTIWQAVIDCCAGKFQCAVLSLVCDTLNERGELDEVGGEGRLMGLVARESAFLYAGRAALEANAEVIHRWAEKRRVIAAAQEMAQSAYSGRVPEVAGVRIPGLRRLT
jgi:replicative DNA helicase